MENGHNFVSYRADNRLKANYRFRPNWNMPSLHAAYQNKRKENRDSLRGVGSTGCGLYEPEANKL